MDDGPGRTLRRRKLGKELRRHRDAAGLSLAQVGKYAGLAPGTLSKIENGRQAILSKNVRLVLQACNVGAPTMDNLMRLAEESDERGWWLSFSDSIPDWFATFVDMESDAVDMWTYAPEYVDGLVQTAAYAEAVARAAFPKITEDRLRRSVDVRKARQAILDGPRPPRLDLILNEPVIHRGPPDVMREQRAHLVEMGDRPNISIRILPIAAGLHAGGKASFTLLRFPEGFDEFDCVYLENENGGVWQERPSDIGRYTEVFRLLGDQALSEEATRALLVSLS